MGYHVLQDSGLCLYCGEWCEQCNQCKCEIKRKRVCPQFDTKQEPVRFERWKIERDIDYLFGAMHYDPNQSSKRHDWYRKKVVELDDLLSGSDFDALYSRRDHNGLAYYDS